MLHYFANSDFTLHKTQIKASFCNGWDCIVDEGFEQKIETAVDVKPKIGVLGVLLTHSK